MADTADHAPTLRRPAGATAAGCLIVAGILTAACLWLSLSLLRPIPPRTVTIASGPAYSLFHRHAQAYREALAREGVTVVERPTEGAGENMDLLAREILRDLTLSYSVSAAVPRPTVPAAGAKPGVVRLPRKAGAELPGDPADMPDDPGGEGGGGSRGCA